MKVMFVVLLLTTLGAPVHAESLETILQDEADDDESARIGAGVTGIALGLGLGIGGAFLLDSQAGPQNLGAIVVIAGGLAMLVGGAITLATRTELEDIAADYVAGDRHGPIVRLEKLANANEARRILYGGLTALSGLLILVPALTPSNEAALAPTLITGGLVFAVGMYFMLSPSNAEQAWARYRASGSVVLPAPRLMPAMLVSADGLVLGVNGTF